MDKCVEEFLKTRCPGLYQVLLLILHREVDVDRVKLLIALRKLYGDAADILFEHVEKECFPEQPLDVD